MLYYFIMPLISLDLCRDYLSPIPIMPSPHPPGPPLASHAILMPPPQPPGSPTGFSCFSNVAISGKPLSREGLTGPTVTTVEDCARLCLNTTGCSLFIQGSTPFSGCSLMSDAFRGAASTRYDPSVLAACLRHDSDGTTLSEMKVW